VAGPGGAGDAVPSSSGAAQLLTLAGVTKSFPGVVALDNVSFELKPGTVTALLGENGAGKSTLLKVLGGDYQPDEGEISLGGRVVRFRTPADAHAAGVRVIAQEPDIVPYTTVAENIYIGDLPNRNRWLNSRELYERAAADLRRVGFDAVLRPTQIGASLTAAQRQLVEIMRTMVSDATVIAFDEPTSSLSDHEVNLLFGLIRRLRAEGKAIAYVSHRLAEVFEIADEVVILRDGKTVAQKPMSEVDNASLIRLMVGRDLSQVFEHKAAPTDKVVLDVQNVTSADVRDISLKVHAGEIVALAGLVGAGRSEFAGAIVGDLPILSGTVAVDGKRIHLREPSSAIRAGVGYAPEERKKDALFMLRSIKDNATLVILKKLTHLRFINFAKEKSLGSEYLDRLRVRTPSYERLVSTLSGGNQQKVVLARWLAARPKVLVLDEPTRGIDVGAKAEIYEIMEGLAASGVGILMISSELPEILGIADRIIVMQNGHLTGELSRNEATEEKILALAMADDLVSDEKGKK
jgi:L-arabinose transport system ATP-binding protein